MPAWCSACSEWPPALALAGNMAGAIVVSGIGEGEVVPSLTAAPALLVVMLLLLATRDARGGGPT